MTIQAAVHGRLGTEPQERTTKTGTSMTSCSVVADATPGNATGSAALWFNVLAFGKVAGQLTRCRKGDMVSLSGRVTLSQWRDRDGEEHERMGLLADSVVSARTVRGA